MLGALLLQPGRSIPIDELIEWVWPDGKAPRESATFHTYAKRIREALGRMAAPPRLVTKAGTYRMEVDREEVDFFEFRAVVDQAGAVARRGDHEQACRMIAAALDLWTDRPLVDLHGDRARNWRLWAHMEHWIPAQEALLQGLSALGRFDEVLRRIADLPVEHQSNLTLVKRRLEALHGQYRYQDATTYYLGMRKQLITNFDQDEADELTRFHEDLQRRSRERHAAAVSGPIAAADVAVQTPHLLPHDISDFTAREVLLGQLDAMATTTTGELVAGIVVLNGAPGVGKTALAVHWAHRVADRFPGGSLFADLSGFADGPKVEPAEVVDGFLAALGFPAERIPTAAGRGLKLRNLLAGHRVLAVLDNVRNSEHVLPLLDCLSTCLVIVTSRRRLSGLGRRGALSLPVPPLSYQEGKAWLAHRVGERAAREPGATAELTAMCGGIPLTLRVVADHAVTRPRVQLGEFIEELRDGHALLGLGDDGDRPDGSVRTVFSWSYEALAVAERRLFRLLGLHPGPDISLDAAAALIGQKREHAKRCLDVLVNAHLITQPESRNRYRFHDLFRKYAAECAAAEHGEERAAAEDRMLSFYLHTANNADTTVFPYRPGVDMLPLADEVVPLEFADDDSAIDWCVRERANLNAIIQYAGRRGLFEYALRLPSTAGEILRRLGYYDDVVCALTMAIQSARAVGDLKGEAYSLSNLGFVYLNLRNFELAESHLLAADDRYQKIGYEVGSAMVTHHLARLNVERGEFARGIQLHLSALTTLRGANAEGLEIMALLRIGEAYRRAGNLDAASSFCRDGLWLAERLGDQRGQGLSLTEVGTIYYELGDLASAKGYCTRALAIHEHIRDLALAGKTCNVLAAIHRAQGDSHDAERCARRALDFCHGVRDARGEATALDMLAQLFHTQARHEEAAEAWSKALAIFEDLSDPQAASVRARLAEIAASPLTVPQTRTEPLTPSRPMIIR